ncbi:hypothetical protein [Sphingomonas sp. IW22]|uniref:hypothetical protein n=1 Tax=Sphingomonas sp. IW22 TaxID=3242489 RepID=UPI0035215497
MTPRRPNPIPLTPRIEIHPLWCDCAVCMPPAPRAPRRTSSVRTSVTALAAGILTGMALSAVAAWATGGPGPLAVFIP